jgi:hypothetical protein
MIYRFLDAGEGHKLENDFFKVAVTHVSVFNIYVYFVNAFDNKSMTAYLLLQMKYIMNQLCFLRKLLISSMKYR